MTTMTRPEPPHWSATLADELAAARANRETTEREAREAERERTRALAAHIIDFRTAAITELETVADSARSMLPGVRLDIAVDRLTLRGDDAEFRLRIDDDGFAFIRDVVAGSGGELPIKLVPHSDGITPTPAELVRAHAEPWVRRAADWVAKRRAAA